MNVVPMSAFALENYFNVIKREDIPVRINELEASIEIWLNL